MSEIAIKAGAERNIQENEPKAEENVKICKHPSFLCEIRRWCRFSQSPDFFHNCNFATKTQSIYNTANKNLQKSDFNLNFEANMNDALNRSICIMQNGTQKKQKRFKNYLFLAEHDPNQNRK